jgi:hypothetical protein
MVMRGLGERSSSFGMGTSPGNPQLAAVQQGGNGSAPSSPRGKGPSKIHRALAAAAPHTKLIVRLQSRVRAKAARKMTKLRRQQLVREIAH